MMNANVEPANGRIIVSAPGKVILHGEHSVVYGKRGVALSLDLRTTLTLTPCNDNVTLDLPDVKIKKVWSVSSLQKLYNSLGLNNQRGSKNDSQAVCLKPESESIIRQFLNIKEDAEDQKALSLVAFIHLYSSMLPCVQGLTIHVSSQLPTSAGLGSSAAYAVCLAGALLVHSGKISRSSLVPNECSDDHYSSLQLANNWAYTIETIMHGTPSGIDNNTCTFGGIISFKNGKTVSVEGCGLQVLLVNTNVPRSTQALVFSVKQKLEKHPNIINPILDAMDAIAEKTLTIFAQLSHYDPSEDESPNVNNTTSQPKVSASAAADLYQELGDLIDINHCLLSSLGVSHPTLEKIVQVSSEQGLHAKLTGAGGGGFALILVPQGRKSSAFSQCIDTLRGMGCQVWMVDLGVIGLRII